MIDKTIEQDRERIRDEEECPVARPCQYCGCADDVTCEECKREESNDPR